MTTRYPRERIIMIEISELAVPRSMARCEMAKSPNASAIYRAKTNFFAL